ncbi:MAG TPA: PPC domain-containing DNA-binding protein, partial [Verrucomicrobiae bacterium]|nr:PPC domain-containing DNA-binding protein [Verrucomicrobiae bacterium]
VRSEGIGGGSLRGLGAADDVTVGFWDTVERVYRNYRHQGLIEITSLDGNIAWREGEPIVHVHVTAFHETEGAFGGHLVSASVSATVEIAITRFDGRVTRELGPEVGLPLLALPRRP